MHASFSNYMYVSSEKGLNIPIFAVETVLAVIYVIPSFITRLYAYCMSHKVKIIVVPLKYMKPDGA